ncbi:hypothetical protein DSM104440_02689 [Usitatibacter palustris]|uniref:Uncharacterized protein n=1 Tax=Usitatibacter palustris TaxID=2732487 RepID=A0A6M4HB48_9PROT|nr:hypothetical protein DSM104440_02689 [Usitatibacter palustris]
MNRCLSHGIALATAGLATPAFAGKTIKFATEKPITTK